MSPCWVKITSILALALPETALVFANATNPKMK